MEYAFKWSSRYAWRLPAAGHTEEPTYNRGLHFNNWIYGGIREMIHDLLLPLNILAFVVGMTCGMIFELMICIITKWIGE